MKNRLTVSQEDILLNEFHVGDDAWISRVLKLKELKLYYWMMMMVIGHNDYYRLRLGLRLNVFVWDCT
jgi:hypothetical protein